MPNVLTDLAADIYKAADIVGREIVGFVPASMVNTGIEGVAVGQTVRSHFTREAAATDMAPSMTIPEGTDQTVDTKTLQLTKQRGVPIPWTGEDIRFVQGGSGYETIYGDQIAQAMRTIVNEIEAEVAVEAYTNASRAVGAAGTVPFGTNHDVIAEGRQILVDNGMPVSDGRTSLVLSTQAGTKMRNLSNLQKANEAGGTQLLRQGVLLDLQGIMIRESAQTAYHTKGTGTDYDLDGGVALKDSTIALDGGTAGGTGIVAGDVVTFAGDTTNKYVVNTGISGAAGDIVIGTPGIRLALSTGAEMTIGNSYTANVFMHQSALEVAMRPFAKPFGGDAAVDVMVVQDPLSGLVFEISVYKGFNKMMIYVGAVWGKKAWKPDAIALLMG